MCSIKVWDTIALYGLSTRNVLFGLPSASQKRACLHLMRIQSKNAVFAPAIRFPRFAQVTWLHVSTRLVLETTGNIICGNPCWGSDKNLCRLVLDVWLPETVKLLCVFHVNWRNFCIFAGKSQHPIKQGGAVIRSYASKPATVCGKSWVGGGDTRS